MRFLSTLMLLGFSSLLYSQVLFRENFELSATYFPGSLPNGWSNEWASGKVNWKFQKGGHQFNPDSAAEGDYNAMFQVEGYLTERTKLVTPPIDISVSTSPKVVFWLVQDVWGWEGNVNNDEMRVYYKTSFGGNWIKLKEYKSAVTAWAEQEIYLPAEAKSKTLYLAFEGTSRYGHGTCVDDIRLIETGNVPKQVSSFAVEQATSDFVATNTDNNPILRIPIKVQGNTGTLQLSSVKVSSLNTNDADLKPAGLKLWMTTDQTFSNPVQLGTGLSFSSKVATFSSLNKEIPLGNSYLWVTYDITPTATPGNVFDAKLIANTVTFSNATTFPSKEISPTGSRTIFETVYYQNFDASYADWKFSPGFEVGAPSGLGGTEQGSPDPSYAVTAPNVLGNGVIATTDIQALYPNNVLDTAIYAISPTLNLKYYNKAVLRFDQWLNLEGWDKGGIMYSTDGNKTWKYLWDNNYVFYNDATWIAKQFDVAKYADRQQQISFRFSLGPTNSNVRYSGWTIDNFLVVANFIDKDIALTKWYGPVSGCGLSNAEQVKVQIANTSGKVANFPITIGYSFDGGITWVKETTTPNLAIGATLDYTFATKANLSVPNIYKPVAKIFLDGDEDETNDIYTVPELRSVPVNTIPSFTDFEKGTDFWLPKGNEFMTWELGMPSSQLINKAYSGVNAWITSAAFSFQSNDSSMVISPCYSFAGIENPVFEFATNCSFYDNAAGAGLQYSLDSGKTWIGVPKLADKWNWYSDDSIPVLKTKFGQAKGWAVPTNGWKIAKHYLPTTFQSKGAIQFRIIFASESNGTLSDGFAFDDVRIYNAPPDVGVTALISPASACELSNAELIKVNIRNFGIAAIKKGAKVIAGYDLDGKKQCMDTFLLAADLPAGASIVHTYSVKANLYKAGKYSVRAYTRMPLDVDFYDETKNNDTTITQVEVYGMPGYTLGADFGSPDPQTVTLDAGIDAATGTDYTKYAWVNGPTSRNYKLPDQGTYTVTVENTRGCTATASVTVKLSTRNIVMEAITSPVSACVITEAKDVSVLVKNGHSYSFAIGEALVFAYKYGNNAPVRDTLILTALFVKDDIIPFTFKQKLDLTAIHTDSLKVYSILAEDIDRSKDTVRAEIGHYGVAKVDFGRDTLYTLSPKGMELKPDGIFETYLWNDASTQPSLTIADSVAGKYILTVTALHGCGTSTDSLFVSTRDIAVNAVVAPATSCQLKNNETISLKVLNAGNDSIPAGTEIVLSVSADGGAWVTDTVKTSTFALPHQFIEISSLSKFNLSTVGTHYLDIAINTKGDVLATDNRMSVTVDAIGYPPVNLGADTLYASNGILPIINADNKLPDMAYFWNDLLATENPILEVTMPQNFKYGVKVLKNGCFSTDSVMVITDDFKIDVENARSNFCSLSSQEVLKTLIRNNSYNSYPAGTELKVSYQVTGQSPVTETLDLTAELDANTSIPYTFVQKADLSMLSEYLINYWVKYPTDIDVLNDSSEVTSTIVGYPTPDFGFGDTLRTNRPDTVELWLDREYDTYQWHDGVARKDVLYVKDPAPQWYKVTVSFDPGCYGKDSLFIETFDVQVADILSPFSNCTTESASKVSVRIKNNFDYTIPAGDTLFLTYRMDAVVSADTLVLASDFAGLDYLNYTFKDTLTLESNKNYDISCMVNYYRDANHKNDTAKLAFSIYGNPVLALGPDTIFTTQPDSVMLNAGTGFNTYAWNTGSTDTWFYAPYAASYQYIVTVTDFNACSAADTLTIISTDLAMGAIISPADSCKLSPSTNVSFEVNNISQDIINSGEKIQVSISAAGTEMITETIALPQIIPGGKAILSTVGRIDLSAFATVELKAHFSYSKDADTTNNSVNKTITSLGDPILKLSSTKLYIAENETQKVYPLAKYAKYEWSTSETTDTILIAGSVKGWTHLTVTDANGCKATDSVAVQNRDFSVSLLSSFSDCKLPNGQDIQIAIKNEGVDVLTSSEPVTVSLYFDGIKITEQSLSINLAGFETFDYTFPDKYDFATKDAVLIKVVASVANDVIASNNSDEKAMTAYGYPAPQFAQDTIFAPEPSSLSLSVPGSFTTYEWQDKSSSPAFVGCSNNSAWYYLTVSNSQGCKGNDSVYVFTPDIAVTSVLSPVDACIFATEETVSANVKNTGAEILNIGDSLYINATVNGVNLITDTVILKTEFAPGDEFTHTFSKTLTTGTTTKFDIAISLLNQYDAAKSNNTVTAKIQKTGYPAVAFDHDLILTNQPDSVTFNFPVQYTYQWSDGSTANARNATSDAKQQFKVTVTNSIGCTTEDSITILSVIPEIGAAPALVSACNQSAAAIPSVSITNNGLAAITATDNVSVIFTLNGQELAQSSIADMAAGATAILESPVTVDMSAIGSYKLGYYTAIVVYGQTILVDSVITTVETYGYPADAITETVLKGKLPMTITAKGASSYKWSNDKTTPAISVSTSGWFYVTAANSHGCESKDSVQVGGFDIALDSIVFPQGAKVCTSDLKEYPQLSIRNSGMDTLLPGTSIALVVNTIRETYTLPDSLLPYETLLVKPAAKLSATVGSKTITVVLELTDDVEAANNTKTLAYTILKSPSFNFLDDPSADTIQASPPFVLYGPDNYTYKWSTGSTSQSITATAQGDYTLSITDTKGCTGTDVIYLRMKTISAEKLEGIGFEIFPTVCDQEFSIIPSGYVANASLTIVANGSGYYKQIALGSISSLQTVFVGDLPAGGYTIWLDADGEHFEWKIIKQ